MADKRITDVDYIGSLNNSESFFVNQNNTLKQINKKDVVLDIINGGTGATDASTALYNLLVNSPMILSSYQYGDELPDEPTKGRIFFKRVNKQ
jgi:hypothetical protein